MIQKTWDDFDFGRRDKSGRTALMYAAESGERNIIDFILSRMNHLSVDANTADNQGIYSFGNMQC